VGFCFVQSTINPQAFLIILFALCRYQIGGPFCAASLQGEQDEGNFAQVKTIVTDLPDCHLLPPGDANDTRVWAFSSMPSVYREAFVCSPRYPLPQVLHKEATALPKASSQGVVRTCKTLCSLALCLRACVRPLQTIFLGDPSIV
jgi:hypothetical protein